MRLFRLTASTLFRRKSWVLCAFAVGVLPFILPQLSGATENKALMKPAMAQATWAMAFLSAIFWGFYTAAFQGEANSRSGVGEYFQTTGVSPGKQLIQIWLAVLIYVVPIPFISALISIVMASPAAASEKGMWAALNLQYVLLFVLMMAPLVVLAIGVASRFGSLNGFIVSTGLAIYGLYGVGYIKFAEAAPLVQWLWKVSPHYHFADPTERLRYKLGAIAWSEFPLLLAYFAGIGLVLTAISRGVFRVRNAP